MQIICLGGVTLASGGEEHSLESVNKVYVMENPKENVWKEDVPMPLECHNVIGSNLDGNIYIFGGFRTQTMDQIVNTTFYNKKKMVWEPLGDLPKEAVGFVVAICGNI
ncbi:hypothetical protein NPIL_159611 [Nephila pilipes]|uniref:Kelch-like protein n=1 Tax=Nephila pilipes TaxID=299642 RepID=A0A8X6N8M4_NEPPI|nr:hypothetical protein NPIL_159611 [Nephila pilipes]